MFLHPDDDASLNIYGHLETSTHTTITRVYDFESLQESKFKSKPKCERIEAFTLQLL